MNNNPINKLQTLFDHILQNLSIKNDAYLTRLLTHLSETRNGEVVNDILDQPLVIEWLTRAVSQWDGSAEKPPPHIAAFTLNITALLSHQESKFNRLNTNNFYIKLVNVLDARQPDVAPSVKLAYIKLLTAFIEHKSGLEWLTATTFWEDVLSASLNARTIYITREGTRFMAKLLKRTLDYNEGFCNNAWMKILAPINCGGLKQVPDGSVGVFEISDELLVRNLTPTLNLLRGILEHILENLATMQKDLRLLLMLLKAFNLEQKFNTLMMIGQTKSLLFDMSCVIMAVHYVELYINVINSSFEENYVLILLNAVISIFNANLSKGHYENVMKLCYHGYLYWNLITYNIPYSEEQTKEHSFSFSNQLIVMQMLPMVAVFMRMGMTYADVENDEFRSDFLEKIFKILYTTTIRVGYTFRDLLMSQSNHFDIALKSVVYILKLYSHFNKEKAIVIFQMLVYGLKDLITLIKSKPETLAVFENEPAFVGVLLDGVGLLIEAYSISWRESLETICVMSLTFEILSIPTWETKVVVKALKLIRISIEKYMAPNMALLVDKVSDSTMALLGPLLYAKLHDSTWEVRDTALEVVCTMSRISNTQFPSLQRVLIDAGLPQLVIKMALNDGESFVRATAIKCLQEMVKIEAVWEETLKNQDLPTKISQIIQFETEGIVRAESATLMCILYEYHQFSDDAFNRLIEIMSHAVIRDLHWEVKVKALAFWEKIFKNLLSNQGMIDGVFPDVTFSKENRKIVNLTQVEIKKRLKKVMKQSSELGALGVLVAAVRDECDVEVMKESVRIMKKLMNFLRNYDADRPDDNASQPSSPVTTDTGFSSPTWGSGSPSMDEGFPNGEPAVSISFSDQVISQIVGCNDLALLTDVYNGTPPTNGSIFALPVRRVVPPNEFLTFARQDLDGLIAQKINWLNRIDDLDSLLDDILGCYDVDINTMDCY